MLSHLRLSLKYLAYRRRAFKLHGVHSPFVFNLYQNVICHNGDFYCYQPIEDLRQQLYIDDRTIEVTDFGAGSKVNNSRSRKVSSIAKAAAKPAKYAQLLFRLVNHFQPDNILELGTSLGLSTSYLASARPSGKVITLEGCPQTANIAKENFEDLGLKNIQLVTGNFEQTLPKTLEKLPRLDFAFLDGNHRYAPTIQYYEQCLEKAHENSVFVLDDIYWSAGMEKAWKEIVKRPEVTVALDLFQVGVVMFRKNQEKEYFTLKY